jgi:osmoprotectant transport system substrate-binding protein
MSHHPRRTTTRLAALLAAPLLLLAACGDDDDDAASDTTAAAATAAPDTDAPATDAPATDAPATDAPGTSTAGGGADLADVSLTVGSANFPENELLAEVYAQALEANGATVDRQLNIGNRETYYAAIEGGEIQLLPEYTNSLLSFLLRQRDESPTATNIEEQVAALREELPDNLTVLDASTAEDKDVIVCNAETAEQYGLETLSDLAEVSGEITLGAPPEFAERTPFGIPGFQELYGAEFAEFVPLEIGPPIVDALTSNAINCGNLFSTMSVITTEGFVALEDDKTIVPNEAVLPLIATELAENEGVASVLNEVSATLDTDGLKELMVRVEADAEAPADVAGDWLAENGLA